jgi:hypothetical protein
MLMLMGCGIASMFVPVTSAWCAALPAHRSPPAGPMPTAHASSPDNRFRRYPLLHNVYLYGGLGLFTLYIAYDTQKMIDEYNMGVDDHLKHAVDLFIDFKIVFTRVLQLLMLSRGDD